MEADLRKELELANPAHSPSEIVLMGAYAFVEYGGPTSSSRDGGDWKSRAEIAAETIVSVFLRLYLIAMPPG